MEIILFRKDDNSIGYIYSGSEFHSLEEIAVLDVPKGAEWKIIDEEELPADKTFRDAWVWNDGKVDVSLEKAKEIVKDWLRKLREPIFEKLDLAYMRAMEAKDVELQEQISAKKQQLRDITKLDMPDNLEELKSFEPEILKEEE